MRVNSWSVEVYSAAAVSFQRRDSRWLRQRSSSPARIATSFCSRGSHKRVLRLRRESWRRSVTREGFTVTTSISCEDGGLVHRGDGSSSQNPLFFAGSEFPAGSGFFCASTVVPPTVQSRDLCCGGGGFLQRHEDLMPYFRVVVVASANQVDDGSFAGVIMKSGLVEWFGFGLGSAYEITDFWAIGTNCRGELEWETIVEENRLAGDESPPGDSSYFWVIGGSGDGTAWRNGLNRQAVHVRVPSFLGFMKGLAVTNTR
ncbi:hypothetical protein DEO72_LG5g2526 [Vigna unguiculata]|uniref:Uncharacterized protein n=1 Tax=Vigna unguiculata TaxID=3917 RepID=A0A4D6LZZ2_VIGUN|nr:hypothetical protein DEO72_LG5g2526 [Vigna unguiculata]